MHETLIKGDTTELRCLLDFQSRGYYCSVPFSGSCIYDLIVDINNRLYRIQCKASSLNNGVLIMSCHRQTTNTKETIRYIYSKDDFDYYYTFYKDYGLLIPNIGETTSLYLRVNPPKSTFQENMNVASDYLIDNVLYSIQNNIPIQHYVDRRIYSYDGVTQKNWTADELKMNYTETQIRYIKECILKSKKAYGQNWYSLDFPNIDEEYKRLQNINNN